MLNRFVRDWILVAWTLLPLLGCGTEGEPAGPMFGAVAAEAEQPTAANEGDGESEDAFGSGGSSKVGGVTLVDSPWCRALTVLRENCQECHGKETRTGAPMSLTSYDELIAPSFSQPSKPVHMLVKQRIHDAHRPMPPVSPLADTALATLDAWLDAGAPPGSDPTCRGLPDAAGLAPLQPIPWPTDCEVTYEILSHDPKDPSKPFRVEAHQEIQVPVPFDSAPWGDDDVQALAFRPLNDNEKILHHWVLYEGVQGPGGNFIRGWIPGNAGTPKLPDNVGYYLPKGPVSLDMHYYNVAGDTVQFDQSGVEICATRTFRKYTAAVSNEFIAWPLLPPGQRTVSEGNCLMSTSEDLHLLGVVPHMHLLGVSGYMSITRDLEETVIHEGPFSFKDQRVYPLNDVIVRNGDILKTRCTFENTTNQLIDYGASSDKEMCANFTIYWPKGAYSCLHLEPPPLNAL